MVKKHYELIFYLDKRGVSLVQLSELLGVSYTTIRNKIRGYTKFTNNEIAKIKEAYHLTADDVVELFL